MNTRITMQNRLTRHTGVKAGKRLKTLLALSLSVFLLVPPPPARGEKNTSPAFAFQQLDEGNSSGSGSTSSSSASSDGKSIQGGLSRIQVLRGRSQIIKFAQPIVRLSIADPSLADVIPLAPDQIMINGKLRGATSLIVWDEDGQEGVFDLTIQNDASEVLEVVQNVAPNEKIQARITDDSFILSGQVSSAVVLDEIRKTALAYGFKDDHFVDLTDTPIPQVMLDVRMAEANRSVGRMLKTSFSSSNGSLQTFRLANTLDSTLLGKLPTAIQYKGNTTTTTGRATPGFAPAGSLIDTMASNNVGGSLGSLRFNRSFTALWDMLETTGKINILANPSLICTHGRTASFLAGGEFPFVGAVNQNGSPIIQFKEFGVKLNFTPWISLQSGRIEIKVQPEVSNLDTSNCVAGAAGSQICGILKRTTDTTVELQDGESLMISGLLNREEQNTFAKVPFIGNVPVLGNMFKNANTQKSDRELVVIITPHIIKPPGVGSNNGFSASR